MRNLKQTVPALLISFFLFSVLITSCGTSTEADIIDSEEDGIPIKVPEGFAVDLFAEGLQLPTSIRFPPDGSERMFVNELQTGKIWIFEDGERLPEPFAEVNTDVTGGFPVEGEIGLLGLTFDPDYESNRHVYATYAKRNQTGFTASVVRFTDNGNAGIEFTELLTGLPSARGHQIQNLVFGPDDMLYVSVGDAYDEAKVQDTDEFNGKILRMTRDGEIPADNPFGPDSYVYAYGFRNAYDLVFRENGEMISTDNGTTGFDEFNVVLPGKNYGWDENQTLGVTGDPELADPVHVWTNTTAPTGMHIYRGNQFPAEYHGKLFQVLFGYTHTTGSSDRAKRVQVGTLNGEGLDTEIEFEDFAIFEFGNNVVNNPVDVTEGPDGSLYVTDIFQGKIFRIRYGL